MTSNSKFGRFLRSKIFKGALAAGVLVFVGIQFVPVEVVGDNPPERFDVGAPPEVMQILRSSCLDCHSNETRWPWYSHVAPLSWALAPHVVDGRNALNFSEWGEKDDDDRNFDKESAWDSIESGDMPLWTYIFPFHLDAYLTTEKKATLKAWLLAHQDAEDSEEGDEDEKKPAEDGGSAADGDAGSEANEDSGDTPGSAAAAEGESTARTDEDGPKAPVPAAPKPEKKLVNSKPAAPSPRTTSAPKAAPAPKTTPTPAPKEPVKEPEKKPEEVYSGDKPCRAKSFQFASVKAACQKGGVPRAKAVMKAVVDKAKARGEDVKCTSCHTEQKTYVNKPNAVADYRALLNKK